MRNLLLITKVIVSDEEFEADEDEVVESDVGDGAGARLLFAACAAADLSAGCDLPCLVAMTSAIRVRAVVGGAADAADSHEMKAGLATSPLNEEVDF